MKLLLKEDVYGLGSCGDEVEVKNGYGKNFLIPNGHAIAATPKNLKQFKHQKSIVQGRLKKIKVDKLEAGDIIEVNVIEEDAKNGMDWFQEGSISAYNIDISGGGDNHTYYVSGGWNDENGIYIFILIGCPSFFS